MTAVIKRLLVPVFVLLAVAVVFLPHRQQGAQLTPTFNKEVVRILQNNCQTCHHPGDIAPMSLVTYQETKPYAQAIRAQTQARQMPPWKPAQGCGDFQDARVLTADEIATLAAWADAGAPEGNAADLPAPKNFGDGWTLGAPDLVLLSIAPQDALALKYAVDAGGAIDLVLRAPGVEKPFVTDPVDIDYLINRYRIPTGPGR